MAKAASYSKLCQSCSGTIESCHAWTQPERTESAQNLNDSLGYSDLK